MTELWDQLTLIVLLMGDPFSDPTRYSRQVVESLIHCTVKHPDITFLQFMLWIKQLLLLLTNQLSPVLFEKLKEHFSSLLTGLFLFKPVLNLSANKMSLIRHLATRHLHLFFILYNILESKKATYCLAFPRQGWIVNTELLFILPLNWFCYDGYSLKWAFISIFPPLTKIIKVFSTLFVIKFFINT